MNYKTEEINKENIKEFCIFIADQKSENTKHTTSKPCTSFAEKRASKEKEKKEFFPLVILW